MNVLVVGSGAREHAIAWKLRQSRRLTDLFVTPGNAGTGAVAQNLAVNATDLDGTVRAAVDHRIDLVVVGPEQPLADGLVDRLAAAAIAAFGPTQAAARIESSKAFAKDLMRRYGIPTAPFAAFSNRTDARNHVIGLPEPPVVKADGLAAGKGVVVAETADEAEQVVVDMMIRRVHGPAGARILIEERLEGREASVLAFVQGDRVWPLLPAQDYKRAYEGDVGPNTGGMGAIAPAPLAPALAEHIVDDILEPMAAAMVSEGHPYTGVLYAGVMLTSDGPQVLEFNCRFGDPEAQVILPLLEGDLAPAFVDVLEGGEPDLAWSGDAAVCVVVASEGYPGPYPTGCPITGLERIPSGVLTFHAGTAARDGALVTAGGRVLNVVGRGTDLDAARDRAYAGVAAISFEGMQFRRDIGRAATAVAAAATGAAGPGAR